MFDEVDLLRRLAPPARDPHTDVARTAEAQLRREFTAARGILSCVTIRRRGLIAAVVPLALLTTGAAALVTSRPAASAGIACYDGPSSRANTTVLDNDGEDPVATCARAWVDGRLGVAHDPSPPLVACLRGGSAVSVFPSSDPELCRRLGLQPSVAGPDPEAARFAAFRDALVDRLAIAGCVGSHTAAELIRQQLAAHQLTDWDIKIGGGVAGEGFSAERPCASLAFDSTSHTVTLVPAPSQ